MTDDTDLVKRLRGIGWNTDLSHLTNNAADAIEAQAAELVKRDALIAELEAVLIRIGQAGKQIVYCRDGHEEVVLLARAALEGK